MANCAMGFPNRVDAAMLSGGSWVATLPQTNLQTRVFGEVARSVNLLAASTTVVVDFGAAKKIEAVSLRNHNLSILAQFRFTGARDAGFTDVVYDSTLLDVWSVVYAYGILEWEDDNWWGGRYTEEQRSGFMTELIHLMPAFKLARYWKLELFDPNNTDGYVEAGRLFLGPVWRPTINMTAGSSSLRWETRTQVQEARGGAEYFDELIPFRVEQFTINNLEQDEAFAQAFEIQRKAGISGEILFIHDSADTIHAQQRRFLARLRTLSPVEYAYGTINNVGFELKELL